ncbi:hypothetical protein CJP72_21865 [Citrobacter sp. NCU1]|nr:hypothetical protein [Citrobacter sp. NCU1]
MKIIAHGNAGVEAAISIAGTALLAGVKSVTIERASVAVVGAITLGTLSFCPVIECSECEATPCPFERQSTDKMTAAQALYDEAARNLRIAENNLRTVNAHG